MMENFYMSLLHKSSLKGVSSSNIRFNGMIDGNESMQETGIQANFVPCFQTFHMKIGTYVYKI